MSADLERARAAARDYHSRGWVPLAYRPKTKGPRETGWQNKTRDQVNVESDFTGDKTNVGILLGSPSGDLVDVDLDCLEAMRLAPHFLPATVTFGRPSKPASHWLYVSKVPGLKKWTIGQAEGGMALELRSNGGQTMFPPSLHPSGERVAWTAEGEPVAIDADDLAERCGALALASMLLRVWVPGQRNDTALATVGALLDHGWSEDSVRSLLKIVSTVAGDAADYTTNTLRLVNATKKREAAGRTYTGLPSLAALVGMREETLREWVDKPLPEERSGIEGTSAIEDMNRQYAVTWAGGDAVIIREHFDPVTRRDVVSFVKPKAVQMMLAHRCVQVGKRSVPLYQYWLESPQRREFRGVVFEPWPLGAISAADDNYNLFRGWGVEPKAGTCKLFLQHVREVICGGDVEQYDWILAWLADAVQNPTARPGTCVVLRGGQGAGKGIFAAYTGKLLGQHYVHLQSKEKLLGRFNAHLRNALLVFADEVLFGGDKQSVGLLNAIITEPTILVEPKFVDAIPVQNHMRLILATNADWSVPTAHDARRFFMPVVSDHRAGDLDYFTALADEMRGGGPAALAEFLLNHKIPEHIDLRKVPQTRELVKQKHRSLTSAQAFWREALYEGWLVGGFEQMQDWLSGPIEVPRSGVHARYLEYAQDQRDPHPDNAQLFWSSVRKLCPIKPGKRLNRSGERHRTFEVPPLGEAREAFESWQGAPAYWEDTEP